MQPSRPSPNRPNRPNRPSRSRGVTSDRAPYPEVAVGTAAVLVVVASEVVGVGVEVVVVVVAQVVEVWAMNLLTQRLQHQQQHLVPPRSEAMQGATRPHRYRPRARQGLLVYSVGLLGRGACQRGAFGLPTLSTCAFAVQLN